jgi:hypothetical protein
MKATSETPLTKPPASGAVWLDGNPDAMRVTTPPVSILAMLAVKSPV